MPPKMNSVYMFPGPEAGRKKERIEALASAMAAQDNEAPERHRFYPYDSDTSEIITLLRSGSLFSARRLVIVADAHALKAADIKIFREYIASPSPDAVLVFITDEGPGAREYPRSLANKLPGNAVEVFWEMFERDKRAWVMKFFREKGLQADPAAIDLLLDVTEGTTDSLREACELLAFSAGEDKSIRETDVDKALEHGREETVYSLFDRFCRRDLGGVLDAYCKMGHSDPGAMERVTSMLASPLSQLRDFTTLVRRGLSPDKAAGELKLRGGKRALQSYRDGAYRFSERELSEAFCSLMDLEAFLRMSPKEMRRTRTELWFCQVIGPTG